MGARNFDYGATYEIDTLDPIVLVSRHMQLFQDITRIPNLQNFCVCGIGIVDLHSQYDLVLNWMGNSHF